MATSETRDRPEPPGTMNASHRSSWRGKTPITEEAMAPAVEVVPTVYCFRSPHLIVRTNRAHADGKNQRVPPTPCRRGNAR